MGITINPKAYGRLLASELPKPIENNAELDRMVERLEAFDFSNRQLTPEEMALREILAALTEAYGERLELPRYSPAEMAAFLMEQRGLKQADLIPVLGTRPQVSDVVTGKRGISKAQAKKLADFFHVSVEVFI